MLYNSCVTSISDYGHEVIGFHQYPASEKLHSKALRFYLGTGKTAPLCGLRSEMSWPEPRSRTQTRMLRFYFRLQQMDDSRLTKQIFLYDQTFSQANPSQSCWSSEVTQILQRNNLFLVSKSLPCKTLITLLQESLLEKDVMTFKQECRKSKMLRTYNSLFSPFIDSSYVTKFIKLSLPFIIRKRLCQIRLGCLPIKIQTDRYKNIPSNQRYCIQPDCIPPNRTIPVEDELHFVCVCKQYDSLRKKLYSKIELPSFEHFSDFEKFRYLLTCSHVARIVGQFIVNAYDLRVA